jgi:hypothetical protein
MRVFCGAIWLLTCVAVACGDEFETIDGDRFTGTLQAISSSGELSGSNIPAHTLLDSLRSVVRDVQSSPTKAKVIVETQGGGRLLADAVALSDDKFTITLAGSKAVTLSLDAVRSVRLEPDAKLDAFQAALAQPSADQDKIFVKVEQRVDTINGLIVELNDKELTFEFEGEERKLPRERLHGIVLAQATKPPSPSAMVQLTNGSRLAGKVTGLEQGQLQVEVVGGTTAALSLDSVARIDLRSSRLAYLSDLEPATVREEAVLTLPKPWQRDRSVGGKTLTVGGKTFTRGIGVHAQSELTYEVPDGFDTFVATVGIDAETQGRGDCEVAVLGDDRALWNQRIKATEAPQQVQVSLRGVKRLTLRVLPGADFDLGDHLDWCDARLLKQAK